ncbi:MAG: glycoside hydrolase family 57 protein [Phycisphaerae bacterium]|nr:glycoside hydrolase family 57 protein [Phycisphaerae bacterium]
MASVVFYFQVHQPFRLRPYTIFDTGGGYFDDARNKEICCKVSDKCYLPTNAAILGLIEEFGGKFRVSYSLTGTVIEQFRKWRPDVLESFQALAETGCVEFIAETYCHSLVFLYNREEFIAQTRRHHELISDLFGREPKAFRNTELMYNNDVAHVVEQLGYKTVLTEGADHILGYRSPNFLYHPPNCKGLNILLKNYRLSDDIAFRFSNQGWSEWPLTAEKFAGWVNRINGNGFVCNLFMDYETFGEHQWKNTGIFDFLQTLPGEILEGGENDFLTISEAADRYPSAGEMDVPHMISWADTERDISAWLGNSMQANALHDINEMAAEILASGDEELIHDWRLLQSSDHFYYMCTKYFADGDVHKYFNPYESPYEAYINYMNILDNVRARINGSRS